MTHERKQERFLRRCFVGPAYHFWTFSKQTRLSATRRRKGLELVCPLYILPPSFLASFLTHFLLMLPASPCAWGANQELGRCRPTPHNDFSCPVESSATRSLSFIIMYVHRPPAHQTDHKVQVRRLLQRNHTSMETERAWPTVHLYL